MPNDDGDLLAGLEVEMAAEEFAAVAEFQAAKAAWDDIELQLATTPPGELTTTLCLRALQAWARLYATAAQAHPFFHFPPSPAG